MFEHLLQANMRYYVTFENVIWPNLCYTQKYDIFYLHCFTYEKV